MEKISALDWSQFTVEIPLNTASDLIEKAWTTQKGIESWFLRDAIYKTKEGRLKSPAEKVQPGDTYAWRWHGWPDSMEEYGEILESGKEEFFRFVFGKAGIVSLGLTVREGDKILVLKQTQIPTDEAGRFNFHVGCKTGWTFYLANLKSILLDGPDLRNKNQALEMD